jgi:glucoamylase
VAGQETVSFLAVNQRVIGQPLDASHWLAVAWCSADVRFKSWRGGSKRLAIWHAFVREGACVMRRSAAGGLAAAVSLASLVLLASPGLGYAASSPPPPGAPGAAATWTPADKHGFGTATGTASKVWYTLEHGELTEAYYPDLGTPSLRDLQFIVTDGSTFADLERDATTSTVTMPDQQSLTYIQTDTAKSGRYRLIKTYVTDPARSTVLVNVTFQSLTGQPYQVYAYVDPSLTNNGMDDSGTCDSGQLLASDGHTASAVLATPGFAQTSCGYLGTSDGWTQLQSTYALKQYTSAPSGNVVETARLKVDGVGQQHATLAVGFGGTTGDALTAAQGSLTAGFSAASSAYADGWHSYLSSLKSPPPSLTTAAEQKLYDVSVMVLAASEDKTYRGAFIASPTMPWAWGTGLENPSGAYHLVWSRDLYEMATALLAAGDTTAANRALSFLFDRQQKPDGSFPQNSTVDGTPHWTNTQMDEVADPVILAWMLHRTDLATYTAHIKPAADYIAANGPVTQQDRWENQGGYSPATIAAEIAGLVCAADLAKANSDNASATKYLRTADAWQKSVASWTVTTNGPLSASPYYLRLTKDGNPNAGTTYNIGDSGPNGVDQRAVVDPSFLELVRLGIKPATDPAIVDTIKVVDAQLGVPTPNGEFWHRYNRDGYGEQPDGSPWNVGFPPAPLTAPLNSGWGTQATIGRIWPIFAGERGEYNLAAGLPAQDSLAAMVAVRNDGYLLPEQVWDAFPPSGKPGFASGTGTFSATPLAWSHAQYIRLAWSITAGHPIERPSIVACRYVQSCP